MKVLTGILLLTFLSCSHKVIKDGGNVRYDEKLMGNLSSEDYYLYAQSVVTREQRDPPDIKLETFLNHPEFKIKKVAIVVFETIIQPTRNGLSSDQNIYLSAKGKQKLSTSFYRFWFKGLKKNASMIKVVGPKKLTKSTAFSKGGRVQEDYILGEGLKLNDADIFYLSGGKNVTPITTLNPKGMRDLSMVLVPATNLMMGPKFSEYQKHWVNELSKDLELDAVIVVQTQASWERASVDKRTKAIIPEEMKMSIESSLLIPFSRYQNIVSKIKPHDHLAKVNVPIATYRVNYQGPVYISVPSEQQNFETINNNLLNPLTDIFGKLSYLMLLRLSSDLSQLH